MENYEMMKRELLSHLAAMVEAGDITDIESMEWYNMKCDQWEGGDR